jgi:subtilase family serine protease
LNRTARTLFSLAAAATIAAAFLMSSAGASTSAKRITLSSPLPAAVAAAPSLGATPPDKPVELLLDLRLRHQAELSSFIGRVSDPASPDYAHYLSAAEFRSRYAPTDRAVAAAKRFAVSSGFRVTQVPANHHYVAIAGTAADAESAFGVELRQLRLHGKTVHAPVGSPSIPSALGRYVTKVSGLDTGEQMRPASITSAPAADPPPAFVPAKPCSKYFGQRKAKSLPKAYGRKQPYAPCGYTPKQIRKVYGVTGTIKHGIDGSGQKVAIVDAYDSPKIKTDVNTYSKRHGLPKAKITRHASQAASTAPEVPGTFVDPEGWAGEETLDVEAVHTMAPKAKVLYYGADSPLSVDLTMALNSAVDAHQARVVSNSYGSAGDFDESADDDPIFQQAAATGIGIYFSSGDEGDETQDPNGPGDREADAPANDPMVTAVGGTSLRIKKSGGFGGETYWGTSKSTLTGSAWQPTPPGDYLYGGGGGVSQTYAQPAWQKGIVPKSVSHYFKGKPAGADAGDANGHVHVPGRAEPDVSMVGDPNTGFLVGLTQDFSPSATTVQLPTDDYHYGEYRIGGTSLSCPLFAGLMALADQRAGKPHGFANPALYALYRKHKRVYRDVKKPKHGAGVVRVDFTNNLDSSGGTTTSLRSFGTLNTLHSLKGYDDSTGLGTPRGNKLIKTLAP